MESIKGTARMTAAAKLPEKWLAKAATCRADAERLGEGNPVHNELLRDAAQYEQCAHALKLALSPAELGGVEPVAFRCLMPMGGAYAKSGWMGIDELQHYGLHGNLVKGPHPDWRYIEYAYTTPRAAEAVTDEMVGRALSSYYRNWSTWKQAVELGGDLSGAMRAALTAALTTPSAKGEKES